MSSKAPSYRNDDRGVAVLEFAIVGPIMVAFIFFVVDVAMSFISYFEVNHVLRVGLRLASQTPNLEQNTVPYINSAAGMPAGHLLVQGGIDRLLQLESLSLENGWTISTMCNNSMVTVQISGTYKPILTNIAATFGQLKFGVSGAAPYLYSVGCKS